MDGDEDDAWLSAVLDAKWEETYLDDGGGGDDISASSKSTATEKRRQNVRRASAPPEIMGILRRQPPWGGQGTHSLQGQGRFGEVE